jgi:hypothetical protein
LLQSAWESFGFLPKENWGVPFMELPGITIMTLLGDIDGYIYQYRGSSLVLSFDFAFCSSWSKNFFGAVFSTCVNKI